MMPATDAGDVVDLDGPAETSTVELQNCPVGASLDIFSRKWTFMVLRDIAYYKRHRFTEFLENNPGMTPRILSKRLNEMVDERLIVKTGDGKDTRYHLGPRGVDTLPMLLALFQYGIKHRADEVFGDGRPRRLAEVVPQWGPDEIAAMFGYGRVADD